MFENGQWLKAKGKKTTSIMVQPQKNRFKPGWEKPKKREQRQKLPPDRWCYTVQMYPGYHQTGKKCVLEIEDHRGGGRWGLKGRVPPKQKVTVIRG